MKSGVPWQVKGVRPQARETAREAARRSGMSVGEWLDNIILDSALHEGIEPRDLANRRSGDPTDEADADQADLGAMELGRARYDSRANADRDEVIRRWWHGYGDRDRPLPRPDVTRAAEYESAAAPADRERYPHADRTGDIERNDRPANAETVRRAEELAERLSLTTVEDRYRPVVDRGFSEVKDRLDGLTRQMSELTEIKAAIRNSSRPDHEARERESAYRPIVDKGFAEVNNRLDTLHRQLDQWAESNAANSQLSRHEPREAEPPRELVEVIAKLDRRLDQLIAEGRSAKTEIEQRVNAVDRAVADLNRERPRVAIAAEPPTPLDQALIEIADRQRTLDGYAPLTAGSAPSLHAATPAEPLPRPRTQELSGLEQQLRQINSRIETLGQPCGLDKAVETLRDDLAEIGVMLQEAMPRKAVEALEGEVRNLAERIDHTRHAGADEPALAGVERGLAEVRDALRGLTPAENLVGVDRAVQQLSQKIDLIADNAQDPATLRQLEGSITAMRGIVSHVASNDALARLSEDVRALTDKVDRAAGSGSGSVLSALEERIAALADALEARNQRGQNVPHELDDVVKGLSDKIERIQLTRGDNDAFAHLEDRIAKLVEKLDASDARLNHLEAIERGLAELLIQLEHQRIPNLARSGGSVPPELDSLSRDLADLRQTEKKTQDTLEVVHGTLGHVVDRLAMIETDMRGKPATGAAPSLASSLASSPVSSPTAMPVSSPAVAPPPPTPPDLAPPYTEPSSLEPPSFYLPTLGPSGPDLASPRIPSDDVPSSDLPILDLPSAAIAAEEEPHPAPAPLPPSRPSPAEAPQPIEFTAAPQPHVPPVAAERRPIDPNLPPDHPLEPGFSATRGRNPGSPADRIAASEAALAGAKPPVIPDPGGKANFIAAARRAAQAAGREAPPKSERTKSSDLATAAGKLASRVGKLRALIGGSAAVLLLVGSFQIARMLLSSDDAEIAQSGASSQVATAAPETSAAAPVIASASEPVSVSAPTTPTPATPPAGRTSGVLPAVDATTFLAPVPGMVMPRDVARPGITAPTGTKVSPAAPGAEREVTGSAPPTAKPFANPPSANPSFANAPSANPPSASPAAAPAPAAPVPAAASLAPAPSAQAPAVPASPSDKLPASFGGTLRTAAAKGDPAAQYEVAVRYAEGRGVQQSLGDAAEWFERAAKQGLAPAQFRLGGLYEKGLGVKKNLDTARRFYLAAGEAGNAKALHNLAVLYAEGIDGKPDYQTAARWFRKAADYGVADSQYNLAVLYTRGIGVEQNLAEAYRWFTLAAREGDAESAKRRDEIGARLDQQTLQTVAQAAQGWTPDPQPELAVQVKAPSGGWSEGAGTSAAAPVQRKPTAAGPKLDLAIPRQRQ
jgi:localization factor PodJL